MRPHNETLLTVLRNVQRVRNELLDVEHGIQDAIARAPLDGPAPAVPIHRPNWAEVKARRRLVRRLHKRHRASGARLRDIVNRHPTFLAMRIRPVTAQTMRDDLRRG